MSESRLYVGYRRAPAPHRRAMRLLVPALALLLVAVAALTAASQRDPGDGVWDTGNVREFEGVVVGGPYPMLATDDDVMLVVEAGKVGSQARLGGLLGHRVRLSGFLLERADRRMIELEPGDAAIEDLGTIDPKDAPPFAGSGRAVAIEGEILDSKCYLGAMKPGDGKAHRACATLCIDGGIAPMLYAAGRDGSQAHFVLMRRDGKRSTSIVREFLGEPVRVTGRPARLGTLDVLLIDEGAVERVGR